LNQAFGKIRFSEIAADGDSITCDTRRQRHIFSFALPSACKAFRPEPRGQIVGRLSSEGSMFDSLAMDGFSFEEISIRGSCQTLDYDSSLQ
jgi:hypothetical protein